MYRLPVPGGADEGSGLTHLDSEGRMSRSNPTGRRKLKLKGPILQISLVPLGLRYTVTWLTCLT